MRHLSSTVFKALVAAMIYGPLSAIAQTPEGLVIRSKEWMNPLLQALHTNVTVKRMPNQAFGLAFTFDVPMPEGGIDPTAVHFFAFCVAGHITAKERFPAWSLGTTEPNLKYNNTRRMDLVLAVLSQSEKPENVTGRSDVTWWGVQATNNPNFRETCSRLLRTEYMWRNE